MVFSNQVLSQRLVVACFAVLCIFSFNTVLVAQDLANPQTSSTSELASNPTEISHDAAAGQTNKSSRLKVLIGSLTIFLLAVFVGVEIITKVPPTLHTPLMSGSNAISGITIVGAIIAAGHAWGTGHSATAGLGTFVGFIAVILAMINVVGGFLVTHRMLKMFKKR